MAYLDTQTLDELREVLGDDLGAITGSFVEQLQDQIQELVDCFGRGDLVEGARLAHALKGGAGNLGAGRLSQAAAALERHARAGAHEMVAASLAELPEIAHQTIVEFRDGGYLPPLL